LSRHAKNRLRRYVKYGITAELVVQAVQERVAAGASGHGLALVGGTVGDFRIAFVVEADRAIITTIMPPRRGGL